MVERLVPKVEMVEMVEMVGIIWLQLVVLVEMVFKLVSIGRNRLKCLFKNTKK